jgi:hypothetical protein
MMTGGALLSLLTQFVIFPYGQDEELTDISAGSWYACAVGDMDV